MIKIANKEISDFIEYLNNQNENVPDVYLYVIPERSALKAPDGTVAYAAYNALISTIVAAGESEEEGQYGVLKNIAHEFYHHREEHYPADSDDEIECLAEKFAREAVEGYLNEKARLFDQGL